MPRNLTRRHLCHERLGFQRPKLVLLVELKENQRNFVITWRELIRCCCPPFRCPRSRRSRRGAAPLGRASDGSPAWVMRGRRCSMEDPGGGAPDRINSPRPRVSLLSSLLSPPQPPSSLLFSPSLPGASSILAESRVRSNGSFSLPGRKAGGAALLVDGLRVPPGTGVDRADCCGR